MEDVSAQLLSALLPRLRRAFPHTPRDELVDALEDAILATFDATWEIPLSSYIHKAAWRNVVDRQRSDLARQAREAAYVETRPSSTDAHADTRWLGRGVLGRMLLELARRMPTRADRKAFRMWVHGERGTSALAGALGLAARPTDEQRQAVKRFKDRIRKALRSLRGR
jgi:hypothetical protein